MTRRCAASTRSVRARVRRSRGGGRRALALLAALVLAAAAQSRAEEGAAPASPAAPTASPAPAADERPNGFSLDGLRVPRALVRAGGPQRDQIRAVDAPKLVAPDAAAAWARGDTPVLGVMHGTDAHAHPVHVIERHQVVNDEIGGEPIAVFYDPLGGVATSAKRTLNGKVLVFGVSGLVYNGTSLYFDRQTESLWSPLLGSAIAGPLAGTTLERVRTWQEPLDLFLGRAPKALVLERPDRGLDYRVSPYQQYWVDERLPFPVAARDEAIHPKATTLGVIANGRARAYTSGELRRAGGRIADELEGRRIRIAYDGDLDFLQWEAPDDVEVVESYFFAWKAFHPDTGVWKAPESTEPEREPAP